jgi:hypothetical protein
VLQTTWQNEYNISNFAAPGFLGIKVRPLLDRRYLINDAGEGLKHLANLGRQIGVSTPNMAPDLRLSAIVLHPA